MVHRFGLACFNGKVNFYPMMTLQELLEIAPTEIHSLRSTRYTGGGVSQLLREFSLDEQAVIQTLYEELRDLMKLLDASGEENAVIRRQLQERVQRLSIPALQEQLVDSLNETEDPRRARIFFDLAGGALSSLVGYLLLIRLHGVEPGYRQTLYYLVRDHLKIMRALLSDLDPIARARDEAERCHSIDLLLEKWRNASYRAFEQMIEVRFTNFFQGHVAERCVEFAEIDNLFYHLANNCIKFSSDGVLNVHVGLLPDQQHLRWVFSNTISEGQAEALLELRASGRSIFERDVSSMGKGLGLAILAESVSNAYGYEDCQEAEEDALFGYRLDNQKQFSLWFHWPSVRE